MSSSMAAATKLAHPMRSLSQDSDNLRKRVCKACDRCRLKKSKCDGSHPCTRCKADNAICVFGERKKSHDKIYPRGYVEMLEQQQSQLVAGLQEMYRRALAGRQWTDARLPEVNGQPLTHDILAALNLLDAKHDGTVDGEGFEEDCDKLQSRLLGDGAGYMPQRRGSFSSDSEHSQHGFTQPRIAPNRSPTDHQPSHIFRQKSDSVRNSPSPLQASSPAVHQRQPFAPQPQPSPLQHHSTTPMNDPQLYQPEWFLPEMPSRNQKNRFNLQLPAFNQPVPELDNKMFTADQFELAYDENFLPMPGFSQQFSDGFGGTVPVMQDLVLDPMDLELNRYVQVTT